MSILDNQDKYQIRVELKFIAKLMSGETIKLNQKQRDWLDQKKESGAKWISMPTGHSFEAHQLVEIKPAMTRKAWCEVNGEWDRPEQKKLLMAEYNKRVMPEPITDTKLLS